MVFSDRKMVEYHSLGYTVAEGFFTLREVEAFRLELDRFVEQGMLRNVTTTDDGITRGTSQLNLQILPVHPHSRLFRAVPFHSKVIAAVTQLLGEPVIM